MYSFGLTSEIPDGHDGPLTHGMVRRVGELAGDAVPSSTFSSSTYHKAETLPHMRVVAPVLMKGSGASRSVCRSQGFNLLALLQSELQEFLQSTGALPTSGNVTIAAEQIQILGYDPHADRATGEGWDTSTLRALYAAAQRAGIPSEYTASIANDLQLGRLSPGRFLSRRTMQAAMWFPLSTTWGDDNTKRWGRGSPAEINFADGVVFPAFGAIPPLPSNRFTSPVLANCAPEASLGGATAPMRAPSRLGASILLILGLAAVGIVGASILGGATPTREELRGKRRKSE